MAAASAASAPAVGLALKADSTLAPPPRGDALRRRPVIVRADSLRVRPDLDSVAEGAVEFRRGGSVIRADRLSYDNAEDRAVARGSVQFERDGNSYRGSELTLVLQKFEGFLLAPQYEFARTGAGGRAGRIEFIDGSRSVALEATYSSCPRDGSGTPDWLLTTRRVKLDFDTNEGVAEGAVLRFLGLPILALPVLSFPLTDDRKSGWLPPKFGLDSRSGIELAVPYYWNIAPHRDATLTPTVLSRRGVGLGTEFRYLEPAWRGELAINALPFDRVAGRSRMAARLEHEGQWGDDVRYQARWLRVSDADYWKDFPGALASLTPRLLPADARVERTLALGWGRLQLYSRLQHWQVIPTDDASTAIVAPYQRSPQAGARLAATVAADWKLTLESEVNRFTLPTAALGRPEGWRWHALGQASRTWGNSAYWLTPKLSFNTAAYATEDPQTNKRQRASRTVPGFSLDAGLVLEQTSNWFGRSVHQTLEPRALYLSTPYRAQASLPNYDAANRDFNILSVFSESPFSGVDRVADTHQLTVGTTTRFTDASSGAELLRLGLAQRFLLRDQRITLNPDGSDGALLNRRFSDLLLEGASTLWPGWTLDSGLQYNPDTRRLVRSIVAARWSPGPFQTLGMTYRLARGLSEQVELGWQWPVYRSEQRPVGASGGCGGTLYGVGRVNYSLRDSRVTDSIVGVEYDTGCWIGRIVAERQSTGRSEATTKLALQLELVGLSRLGANPLQSLKDNIPGYQLLRDPRSANANAFQND